MSNLEEIYGLKSKWYENRKKALSDVFYKIYKEDPTSFFSSPGRIEVLGNHTDHNNGLVMVSSVNLDIFAAVKERNDGRVFLKSEGYPINEVSIDDLAIYESEIDKSNSLIRGSLKRIKELGYKIGGFEAASESNIFKGAGLSSSAAFELLIIEIENQLYNKGKIPKIVKAQIGQYAENTYYGKPSGLLDQMGISMGGANYIDFKDTDKPDVKNFKMTLDNYRIVLVNTGGSHGNLTPYYASIKEDMKKVAKFFGKDSLREVNENEFEDNLKELKKKVGGRAILRSLHFFDENKRVKVGYEALIKGDISSFLNMINESGNSSYMYLENCFVQKDDKQGIALALALSKKYLTDGAVRVHGGGFKGTIIAYVNVKEQMNYIRLMKSVFGDRNVIKVELRSVGATKIIE